MRTKFCIRPMILKITHKPEISCILHFSRTNGITAQWKENVTGNCLDQECHTRGLTQATLHVWNCAEGRMQFLIWGSPLLRISCNVAQSEVDPQKRKTKKFFTSQVFSCHHHFFGHRSLEFV